MNLSSPNICDGPQLVLAFDELVTITFPNVLASSILKNLVTIAQLVVTTEENLVTGNLFAMHVVTSFQFPPCYHPPHPPPSVMLASMPRRRRVRLWLRLRK